MSAQKKVVTVNGEKINISECKSFDSKWYKIGKVTVENSGDCYLINNRFYRVDHNDIRFNHSIKEYVIDNSLAKGIISINEDDVVKLGYMTYNPQSAVVTVASGSSYHIIDESILKDKLSYKECLEDGNYYHISRMKASKFNRIKHPSKDYKYSLPYDSKGIIDQNLKNYNNNYKPVISTTISKYAPLLEDLTFGLEFETSEGFIPNRILDTYGLIPLRDGSISGIEYVTVPMSGEKGLQCTVDICKEFKKRTRYEDKSCSLHLHLGGMPRTKEFILAFIKTAFAIQDEMFSIFPMYKKYNYGIKNKNYTAPLPTFDFLSQLDAEITPTNIDKNFNVLYKYFSMGQDFENVGNDLNNVEVHPADQNENQKWNVRTRYHMFNLIPLIFGNKKTIEFRIHTPTNDENKIIPFILMNSLIVNFVVSNQKAILSNPKFLINRNICGILSDKINSYNIYNSGELVNLFYNYFESRKESYVDQTLSGNILGTEDKVYTSNYIDWSSLEEEKKPSSFGEYYGTDELRDALIKLARNRSNINMEPTGIDTPVNSKPISYSDPFYGTDVVFGTSEQNDSFSSYEIADNSDNDLL